MTRLRTSLLLGAAVILPASYWGPGVYLDTVPLTIAVAHLGGTWREMHIGNSAPIPFVSHQIDEYCFSPGVGAIAEVGDAAPDSLFRYALAIKDGMIVDARRLGRNNITVTLEHPRGIPWPWRERELTFVTFHRAAAAERWKVTTVSGDLSRAMRARILDYNGPITPVTP